MPSDIRRLYNNPDPRVRALTQALVRIQTPIQRKPLPETPRGETLILRLTHTEIMLTKIVAGG